MHSKAWKLGKYFERLFTLFWVITQIHIYFILTDAGQFFISEVISIYIFFIFFAANISTIVCQDEQKMLQLLSNIPRSVKLLIAIKDISEGTKNMARKLGIDVKTFEQIEAIGAQSHKKEVVSEMQELTRHKKVKK